MQHWEILIIPLIALGVWIIGTLFKSEEEKGKRGVSRRGNGPGRAPGRRLVTGRDLFIDEARRRREPEERRKAPTPTRVSVARSPLRERPPQPRETPRLARPAIVKEEAVAVLPAPRPVAPPPIAEPASRLSSPKAGEGKGGVSPAHEAPAPPASTVRPSPIAQQLRSLLSKPQTAATAFALREIFDRPLCKRPH
jgi:hypothetical protein